MLLARPSATPLPDSALKALDRNFPARIVPLGKGQVSIREAGVPSDLPLVCLHGIGSGAASWLAVAEAIGHRTRVIAWDAPGYGESSPLPMAQPRGRNYADCLNELLDELGLDRCVLVGHSLGALMSAPAACDSMRVAALVLISPAQGYGASGKESERQRVHEERLSSLASLGIAGMAATRAGRLVSGHASSQAHQWVQWNMARLHEHGYRQAIELLCSGDLLADLPAPVPTTVVCGELDAITTPASCAAVALKCEVALEFITNAGHACYVERPAAVANLLERVLDKCPG